MWLYHFFTQVSGEQCVLTLVFCRFTCNSELTVFLRLDLSSARLSVEM